MQDPIAALAVAGDRVGAPQPAARAGYAFGVELARDRGRAFADGVVGEDPANDRGLVFVDFAQPAFGLAILAKGADLAIAKGQPAGNAPGLDPAHVTAANLVGQLFKKQRRHRRAQPDMHRPDFAFGKGDEPRAGKADPLEYAGQVFLVARNPVETFSEQDRGVAFADRAGRGDQTGAVPNRTADRRVGMLGDDASALAIGAFAQQAQLVFDRILRLKRGRVSRVKYTIGHFLAGYRIGHLFAHHRANPPSCQISGEFDNLRPKCFSVCAALSNSEYDSAVFHTLSSSNVSSTLCRLWFLSGLRLEFRKPDRILSW